MLYGNEFYALGELLHNDGREWQIKYTTSTCHLARKNVAKIVEYYITYSKNVYLQASLSSPNACADEYSGRIFIPLALSELAMFNVSNGSVPACPLSGDT